MAAFIMAFGAGLMTTPSVQAAPNKKDTCESLGGSWHATQETCSGYDVKSYCELTGRECETGGATTSAGEKECGGVTTSIISCKEGGGDGAPIEETGVWGILLLVVNILTAGVGVAALGGLIYGAVLYTSSGGSPDQIKKARNVFTNVVVGIIAFAAMYAVLNFIVPGGVFQ